MKSVLIFTFILFSLASCAPKKSAVKSNFKIVLGKSALEVPMLGGAFIETFELTSLKKDIIQLDAENSATIPNGTYDIQIIAFSGPISKAGNMYCGSISKASLASETASLTITITQNNCSNSIYTEFKNKLLGTNSLWDSAKFDQSMWGP